MIPPNKSKTKKVIFVAFLGFQSNLLPYTIRNCRKIQIVALLPKTTEEGRSDTADSHNMYKLNFEQLAIKICSRGRIIYINIYGEHIFLYIIQYKYNTNVLKVWICPVHILLNQTLYDDDNH